HDARQRAPRRGRAGRRRRAARRPRNERAAVGAARPRRRARVGLAGARRGRRVPGPRRRDRANREGRARTVLRPFRGEAAVVTELAFLSPDRCAPEVKLASPLARVAVRDLRGELPSSVEAGEELVRLTPDRALLVTAGSPAVARERLRGPGTRVYDLTAGFAALEVEGETLFRRLTDLDPAKLPAAGPVARGVGGVVTRTASGTFCILVPQEYGHYVAEVVLDLQQGLA